MAWRVEFEDFNADVYGNHPVWVDKKFDTYSEVVDYIGSDYDRKHGDALKKWCRITITHEVEEQQ